MGALSAIATPVLAAVAPPVRPSCSYERRAPEDSALHRAVRQGWPEVQAAIREQTGGKLPDYLHKAVKAYLACGQLANGFSRWQCRSCHKDMLVAFSCKVRGLCNSCDGKRMIEEAEHLTNSVLPKVPYRQWVLTLPFDLRYLAAWNVPLRNAILTAAMNAIHRQYEAQARARGIKGKVQSGAVVVTQRASSDLRLNLHFHILAADGVWAERNGQVEFRPASHFDTLVVQEVLHDITLRIDKQLMRLGFKEVEGEAFDGDDPALAGLLKAALLGKPLDPEGLRSERDKRTALRLVPRPNGPNCAQFHGYSLHANTRVGECQREDLYRLVKYLCRPTIAGRRVTDCDDGRFRVELKTPWQDGTKAVVLTAAELTGRLLAATPKPGRPFLRYFWAFGPSAKWRSKVVLAGEQAPGRRKRVSDEPAHDDDAPPLTEAEELARVLAAEQERSRKLTWSDALKVSFGVDVLTCPCGGKRRLIAVITQAKVIKKILRHLGLPTDVVLKETQPVWRQNTWHCAGRRKSFSPRASTRPAREPAPNTWRRKPERV